jgi:hypothetical protein
MKKYLLMAIVGFACLVFSSSKKEEGMFPLSHLDRVDFKEAGFKISQKDIFNPNGVSLTDALVRLGGCTGSFVSEEGLIITNHHCVFSSVAAVSTGEQDYLTKGFMAANKEKELRTSLPCRITESYEDVSAKVLLGIDENTSPQAKAEIISRNRKALIELEQKKYPDNEIAISEMFVGKSYTLFRYTLLEDVRLVYVPPRNVGEFGRETDNWEWPRHTGDFSFVRVYVGKDGKPAKYSPDNIPYNPSKHLNIKLGAKENDLAFILGYPGRTYRHQPSQFLDYQYEHQLPFISNWYRWRIDNLTEQVKDDQDKYLKVAGRMKSWANVEKNYLGKMQGLTRTDIIKNKRDEEVVLRAFASELKGYENVFGEIETLYNEKMTGAQGRFIMRMLPTNVSTVSLAYFIADVKSQFDTVKRDHQEAFVKKNKESWIKRFKSTAPKYDNDFDKNTLIKLLEMNYSQPKSERIQSFEKDSIWGKKGYVKWVEDYYENTTLLNKKALLNLLESDPHAFFFMGDSLVDLMKDFVPEFKNYIKTNLDREQKLNALLPSLLDIKLKFNDEGFIPDANATLRFTYGYIKGYSPQDGEYNYPLTSISGVLEKANSHPDFALEQDILDVLKTTDISKKLKDPKTGKVVVGLLYNMDTSGGNSGSPIMDAKGNLIGVNFDRAFTATINDYAWNESYSRSIGVDIRYIIFIMKYYSGADHLLKEMQVTL